MGQGQRGRAAPALCRGEQCAGVCAGFHSVRAGSCRGAQGFHPAWGCWGACASPRLPRLHRLPLFLGRPRPALRDAADASGLWLWHGADKTGRLPAARGLVFQLAVCSADERARCVRATGVPVRCGPSSWWPPALPGRSSRPALCLAGASALFCMRACNALWWRNVARWRQRRWTWPAGPRRVVSEGACPPPCNSRKPNQSGQ